MKQIKSLTILSFLAVMSSCINDDYDLSDIDTTIGIPVNGLEIPINIEKVKLESVLDIDEGSIIQKGDDGYYMLKEGSFGPSSPVCINEFVVGSIAVNPIVSTLDLHTLIGSKQKFANTLLGYYDLKTSSNQLKTNAANIDDAIVDIRRVTTEAVMSVELKVQGLPSALKSLHLEGVELSLLKGFEIDVNASQGVKAWNKQTGRLCLDDLSTDGDGIVSVKIVITGIELADYNKQEIMFMNNTLSIDAQCTVEAGRIAAYTDDIDPAKLASFQLPDEISFICSPILSDVKIKSFTGEVSYDVTDIDVNPVELNDIPDILNQSGTILGIDNPQIYVEMNNPVSEYGLGATTRLAVQGERDGKLYSKVVSDVITVTSQPMNYFCLSPEKPARPYEYKDKQLEYVRFDVKEILDCFDPSTGMHNGIPDKLHINVEEPAIAGNLTDFPLGTDLNPVEGKYSFYAPVALTEKSKIAYEKSFDGWNDDGELDNVEIDSLSLSFYVTTDVPYALDMEIQPLDVTGNIIKGVSVTIPHIDARASHQAVQAVVKGKVKSLDGIRLKANVSSENVDRLRPDMTITLDEVRAKVYGMYVDYDDK